MNTTKGRYVGCDGKADMSTTHDRIVSHIAAMHDSVRILRTEIELLDGSDPRDRERRGAMRACVGMIDHLLKWLSASAGYMTKSAYGPSDSDDR